MNTVPNHPTYRYLTSEEKLTLLRLPIYQVPSSQYPGVALLVKAFDMPARFTHRNLNTRSLDLALAIQRSRKPWWRVTFFAAQLLAVTIQALQVFVLRSFYRHDGYDVLNSSTNVKVHPCRVVAAITLRFFGKGVTPCSALPIQ